METVTENKVLTQEELQTLNTIQQETQALINELGEIELIKFQLEERREKAKAFLSEVSQKEQDFTQLVFEKYGRVNLNPQTGEITSSL
jgi:ribosome-binding ATPase YchF (GTP1/OBG family)